MKANKEDNANKSFYMIQNPRLLLHDLLPFNKSLHETH